MPIEIVQGDITQLAVDAIVNAANETLLGGGGVDGAIHHAAGPQLLDACRHIPEVRPGVRCPTGEARATPGFALRAHHVIHTVGPVWRDGSHGEPAKLAACYRNSLALGRTLDVQSMAFPAISCGVYGYPVVRAAPLALATLNAELDHWPQPMQVLICCFGTNTYHQFSAALDALR